MHNKVTEGECLDRRALNRPGTIVGAWAGSAIDNAEIGHIRNPLELLRQHLLYREKTEAMALFTQISIWPNCSSTSAAAASTAAASATRRDGQSPVPQLFLALRTRL